MADDMRLLDAELVHEAQDVVGHALDRVGTAVPVALADTPVIVEDDLELAREGRDLVLPVGRRAAEAADEKDREAGPVPLDVKMAVADG